MNKTTLIRLSVAILVMLAVVLVLENNETDTTSQLFVPEREHQFGRYHPCRNT